MSTKGIPVPNEDERVQRAVLFMLKHKTRARANPAPTTDVYIPGAWRPSWARRRLPSTNTTINSTSGARRAIGLTTSTGFGPWNATTRACRHRGRAVETTTDTSHFRPPPLPRGASDSQHSCANEFCQRNPPSGGCIITFVDVRQYAFRRPGGRVVECTIRGHRSRRDVFPSMQNQ